MSIPSVIIHAMHSYYGKDNVPGGRSRRIAESPAAGAPVRAYALLSKPRYTPTSLVTVERSVNSPAARALRFVAVRVLPTTPKRRFAVRQFDRHTARRVGAFEADSVSVVHIWNWLPHTVAAVRARHPNAVVIRDVSIAREYDFEWGEDVRVEDKAVDIFLSPSPYASRQLYSWGIAEDKVIDIPFGVDTERYRPLSEGEDEKYNEQADAVRFAFSGAVSRRKGIPGLLRVWKQLDLDEAELHLYGTVKPEVRPWLSGLQSVYTHGFSNLTRELPRNDVFVFPTTREGSSKAVYEALACGLPVITTENAGSIVREGIEGFLVPAGDQEALARAIERLFGDADLRERMSRAARARAEEFPWTRYSRAVWSLYERASSGRSLKELQELE